MSSTDRGAIERASPADQDPDDDLCRLGEAEDFGIDEAAPAREQRARKAGNCPRKREDHELVPARVVAQELDPPLVLADRGEDAAERGCHQ